MLPDELTPTLKIIVGGAVTKDQVVAETASFFGLFKSRVTAPTTGTLESVSDVTGQAVFREPPVPVEVRAYVDGTIVEILPAEGVVVETTAALVQGIFGLAGEVHAPIVAVATTPAQVLDAADLVAAHAGQIVLGGARITLAGMRRAMELGVAAVVCGGIAYQDVRELLGYDVGVAVTGNEALATTLVVTEGFGDITMAKATFELLRSLAGRTASVCGATQIRAGVIRPEVVVPDAGDGLAIDHGGGLEVGAPVRCIRAPYFGRIGKVAALPVALVDMPSETRVRVLEVDLGDEVIVVPRANVEVIER